MPSGDLDLVVEIWREWGNLPRKARRYGLTPADFEALLRAQKGVCAICKRYDRSEDLVIDHNHHTGEVRGLLCQRCNVGLGYFDDKRGLVHRAHRYLTSPPSRGVI